MNPGPAEPEADMLPSEPTRRASKNVMLDYPHIYLFVFIQRSNKRTLHKRYYNPDIAVVYRIELNTKINIPVDFFYPLAGRMIYGGKK